MSDDILYFIPARGGSKGLPGKNIKALAGKPLICYTIDAARAVATDENIFVSTDSIEIKNAVENYGLKVPDLRPDYLSLDNTSTADVLFYTLSLLERENKQFKYIVILQPTSPLRTGLHLQSAVETISDDLEALVSVFETDSNPYYVLFEEDENGVLAKSKNGNFTRRQDCPIVYQLNGAIYIYNIKSLKEKGIGNLSVKKFVMDKHASIDIDDIWDFNIAEYFLKNYYN